MSKRNPKLVANEPFSNRLAGKIFNCFMNECLFYGSEFLDEFSIK